MNSEKSFRYLKYAAGEIILVVIGILIALQINNWNEGRKNQVKKQNIISEIHQEFLKNKEQLDFIKSMHQFHLENVNKVVSHFPVKLETVNLDSLSYYMQESFADWTFEPVQGRINWLVNSSNFDLIQNEELRDAFLLWEPTFQDYNEDEQDATEYNRQELYPYLRKNFSRGLDLKDDRMDLSVLRTLEFEQMMYARRSRLLAILQNNTKELQRLEEIIDTIINLTELDD